MKLEQVNPDLLIQKISQTQDLISSMIMELRFRGCEDSHKLITQGLTLNKWLAKIEA